MGHNSLCTRPLPHGWSSSRPQSSPTQIRTPPCPAENAALSFSQQTSHLIFMAISTGQLDIGEQKMVLLIAGVSSQDQPEKESMSCQPEPVRLSCMTRLETSQSVTCAHCSLFPQVLSPQVATALSNWEQKLSFDCISLSALHLGHSRAWVITKS